MQVTYRGANGSLHVVHFAFRFIWRAGPEESFEPVTLAPRHDMNVQVHDALAHAIVDGEKRSLGLHRALDRTREQLRIGEKGSDKIRGKV